MQESEGNSARSPEHQAKWRKCDRRADHSAQWLRDQPTETEASRRVFRMAQDDCADAEGTASRDREGRLGVYVRGSGLQPGSHAQSAGASGWCSMTPRRTTFALAKNGELGPVSPYGDTLTSS